MKMHFKLILSFLSLTLSVYTFGQDNEAPSSAIDIVGRYKTGTGIELRIFPDRINTMSLALKSGMVLERALATNGKFSKIADLKAFTEEEWNTAISNASNLESKDNLELAFDFLTETKTTQSGGDIDLDEGILKLKTQKGTESFSYAVFVLTSLKDSVAARALGLSYTDRSVEKGKEYIYRVRLVENSSIYTIKSIEYKFKAEENKEVYKNQVFTKIGDTKLTFVWGEIKNLHGYFVERKNPNENNFVALNTIPFYTLQGENSDDPESNGYQDENLENYKTYTYRFYGTSLFGENELFGEVKAMPRDLTPPQQPFLKEAKHVKPEEVLVIWEMPITPVEGDLRGFLISRSETSEGKFNLLSDQLLPPEAREFTDTRFLKGKTNYYLVQAVDTANNISSSFPVAVMLIDTVPPAQPVFLSAKADSNGVVTLIVTPNKESDLMGYRLLKANGDEHEFSVFQEGFKESDTVAGDHKTTYIDSISLNSMTPYVYYQAIALDYNFNQSIPSEIIKVKRPDIVPPTTPVFKNVIVRKDEIELHFALSESEDVVKHYLYRKLNINDAWEVLAEINNQDTTLHIDKGLNTGVNYYYTLRAEDDSQLYSGYANPVVGKPFDNGVRPPVQNIKITNENNKVILTWEYEKMNESTFFVVYKETKKGVWKEYTNSETLGFSETAEKGKHVYGVKVFTKDGGQSKLSEVVSIEL